MFAQIQEIPASVLSERTASARCEIRIREYRQTVHVLRHLRHSDQQCCISGELQEWNVPSSEGTTRLPQLPAVHLQN